MPSLLRPSISEGSSYDSFDNNVAGGGVDEEKLKFFVMSVDTLCGTRIDQTVRKGWRDRPPATPELLHVRSLRGDDEKKKDKLFKKACREGIPPALRCAMWIICSLHYGEQTSSKSAEQYGTLGKARALDEGWEYVKRTVFTNEGDEDETEIPTFGLSRDELNFFLDCKNSRTIDGVKATAKGRQSLVRILVSIQKMFGITYAPMLPYMASLLLTHMPESYAYVTLRAMVTDDHLFFPTSIVQYYQWCKTFADTVLKLFPDTYQDMKRVGALSPDGLAPIFQRFFVNLLPRQHVYRLVDIFCISGAKCLFRFGIALISLAKKSVKGMATETADDWWEGIRSITYAPGFQFDDLLKRAFGRIGGSFRKTIRFPNRRVILRWIKANELWAEQHAPPIVVEEVIRPLELTSPKGMDEDDTTTAPLAKPTHIRKHLAKWLPPTLRETSLDLIYSSRIHGSTLENLYRQVAKIKRTVMLIEVQQTGDIIGCFASWAWHVDPNTYGDGNCFLFRAAPVERAEVYKWRPPSNESTGELSESDTMEEVALWEQFMVGRRTFLAMGANKGGTNGLRLNEDLTKGSSDVALGFDNLPLAGERLKEFDITRVEVYRFIRSLDGVPLDKVDEVWHF